jgi:hypothetical protein
MAVTLSDGHVGANRSTALGDDGIDMQVALKGNPNAATGEYAVIEK